MKRQGDNVANQPATKKPDVNVSTDFRSKIGAKLQTLLNGFTPDRRLFPRNRRQLYEDLFGEPQHSRIIIDPTIVIKSEPDEESSNEATTLNSQNFLLSAKTRITELLNKKHDDTNKRPFKDNEKENSLSNNEYAPATSLRHGSSYTQTKAQSLLNNSFKKKRKISCSKDNSSEPSSNKVRLKNLVVVVEDIMNSKEQTELNHLVPTGLVESENCSSNIASNSGKAPSISRQSKDLVAKDHVTTEMSDLLTPEVECIISDSCSVISESNSDFHLSTNEYNNCNENNHQQSTSKSPEIAKTSECRPSNDSNIIPAIIPFGDILFEKTTDNFPCNNVDDSEIVDDPGAHQPVLDITNDSTMSEINHEILEPEVVLLCVKRPTHEVITLEDDNDSEDIIEEVHECFQCGKAFRAKSLLNFHIRMHGSDISSSPSSSSQSCSV